MRKVLTSIIAVIFMFMLMGVGWSAEEFPPPREGEGTIGSALKGTNWGLLMVDKIEMDEISAPSGNPASNHGWLYVKDNSSTSDLYFEDDGGTVTELTAAGSTAWDDISNPDADKTITFDDNEITILTFADTNEDMINIQGLGAFGDVSVMRVEQKTGNASDGTVLEVVAADANVDPLVVSASGKANALVVGQNTGVVTIAGVAEGTSALIMTAGDLLVSDGDLHVDAGDCLFDEDVTISGTLSAGTIAMDAVAAATATQTLTLDGDLTGGVTIGATSTGNVTLGDDVVVSDTFNVTIGEGSLTIDNDQTTEWALDITSDAAAAGGAIRIVSALTTTAADTGVISVTADDVTTGDLLYLDSTASGMTTGNFINCNNGSTTVFEVGLYGATTIAGNASTDILTITAGDIQITAGDIDLDNGNLMVDTAQDLASNISRNYDGAGSAALMTINEDHANSTSAALSINQDGTGNSSAIDIVHDGDHPAIDISAGAARTGNVIDISMTNQEAQSGYYADGAWTGASDVGLLHLHATGNIASGGSMIRLDHDTGSSAASGFMMEVEDDSADAGTIYAVLIDSANNEGLHVSAGESLFADLASFTAGVNIDADLDIDFSANTEEMTVETTAQDYAAGSWLVQLHGDHAGNTTGDMSLLRLTYQGDGIANDSFIECVDASTGAAANGDTQFKVDSGGEVTMEGTLHVNGSIIGDGASIMSGVMRNTEVVTAANVIAATECGKVYYLSSATEFQTTLPAISGVSAGWWAEFYVTLAPSGASYTIITGNSLENIIRGGVLERETDTGDDGSYHAAGDTITFVDGVAAVGDYIKITSDGSYFYLTGQTNLDGGITVTQAD